MDKLQYHAFLTAVAKYYRVDPASVTPSTPSGFALFLIFN